jgi:hypothetical protein
MISLGNKTLLTWITNTKEGIGVYTNIRPFPFTHGAFSHPNDVLYFQDPNENNGIHVPFTVRIQTPSQLQTMVSLSDNGAISMDATFDINDVKIHLFTLMAFDAYCTRVLVALIITSRQTCNDLVEWLTPLKTRFLKRNPKWKISCFIVDDVPQEL